MSKKKKRSKCTTASAPKNPTPLPAKSAWAKGPPQLSSRAPSPRSQSPAPSTPILQSHSRRPSALGQGILIKDGVSIPRDNVGAVKQGSAVTFGSIDDVSAPISSSHTAVPLTKSEGVKTFGSVPVAATDQGHVNGKASISSRASVVPSTASTSNVASSVLSAATPPVKPKIDIKKMFQAPSSVSSSNPPSDTSSPSMRNVGLPTQQQQQQPHQGQSSHDPANPSQRAHSFTPFVPSNAMRPPQSNGPDDGPPRSPKYPRQISNGKGPRSEGGQNGGPPAGLSSPRLASHPHNSQTSTTPPPPPPKMQPQMQPQMQPMWYYQYPPPSDQYMPHYQQWFNPMQIPPQHQPPPHTETADKEKEKEKAEAECRAKAAEEICNLEVAATLLGEEKKKKKKKLRRKQEERLRKEAEALELQRLKEEEEQKLKLKQEKERILKAKQEEKASWVAQERPKEEKERKEKEEQEEQERLLKLVEETRLRLEEEAAAKANAEAISEPVSHSPCEPRVWLPSSLLVQDGQLEDAMIVDSETSKSMEDNPKDGFRINTASINSTSNKQRPRPLNLTSAIISTSPVVGALANARVITDIATVPYPEGYHRPHPDLNQNVKNGKFRYDPEFLLQFMSVCKERPATLPPLDTIGLEPVDHTHMVSRGGSGHNRPSSAVPPSRQASIGLGFTPSAFGKSGANLFSMGNFGTMGAGSKLTSEKRYASRNRATSVSGAPLQKHVRQIQPQMHQPTDIVEKPMAIHFADDPTISRKRAISLVQEQEDGLTTDQKIAMISCFMEDVVAADIYILLTDPEVRQGWIRKKLMK